MSQTSRTAAITLRCPLDLVNSIDDQVKQTRQNKTDVILGMLLSSIPSLHITERVKLPKLPGIYFVYTLDHKLLYIGKADNLRTRWNSHHKYQYFIETNVLVTATQLQEVKEELNTLKQKFNDTLSTLVQFGSESIVKKLKNHLPPRGLQKWKANSEEQRDGINRSSLAKHFGFNTVKDLEDAASLFDIDPINYLEELSGWKYHPTGENNPSPKFKPIN